MPIMLAENEVVCQDHLASFPPPIVAQPEEKAAGILIHLSKVDSLFPLKVGEISLNGCQQFHYS